MRCFTMYFLLNSLLYFLLSIESAFQPDKGDIQMFQQQLPFLSSSTSNPQPLTTHMKQGFPGQQPNTKTTILLSEVTFFKWCSVRDVFTLKSLYSLKYQVFFIVKHVSFATSLVPL